MIDVPSDLTPTELMLLRFKAQSEEDFASIYHSSHRFSTLRRSFSSLREYLEFAALRLSGQIRITSYKLLAEEIGAKNAYVLCLVTMSVEGNSESFVEVAELRRAVVGWRYLRCARLPSSALPDDPSSFDLKEFSAHPEAVVY